MKTRAVVAVCALALSARSASADRYEASVAVQPQGGFAWVSEDGADTARVAAGGLSLKATYGLRDWLALDGELGATSLAAAQFEDVMVSIGGAPPSPEDLTRTTRTARLAAGATLRLGVAWIPTISLGFGAQSRLRGDASVAGSGLVADGREGGLSIAPVAYGRMGLDRRLTARWIMGASVGAQYDLEIATVEVGISVARYWYPSW